MCTPFLSAPFFPSWTNVMASGGNTGRKTHKPTINREKKVCYTAPGRAFAMRLKNEVPASHEAEEVPLEEQGGVLLATRPDKTRRVATRTRK